MPPKNQPNPYSQFKKQLKNLKWFMVVFSIIIIAINTYYIQKIRRVEEKVTTLISNYQR